MPTKTPSVPRKARDIQVVVNKQRCRSCGICIDLCPEKVFIAEKPLLKARVVDLPACTGCRLCEWLCTDWAINVVVN